MRFSTVCAKFTYEFFNQSVLQLIVFVVVGIGILFSVVFHLGVKEKPFSHQRLLEISDDVSVLEVRHMTWKSWFVEPHFYIVSIT